MENLRAYCYLQYNNLSIKQMTGLYDLHIDSKIIHTFSPRTPPLELEPKPESPLGPLGPLSPFSPLSPRSPFSPLAPRAPIKWT